VLREKKPPDNLFYFLMYLANDIKYRQQRKMQGKKGFS
jgi:hypothetical protein